MELKSNQKWLAIFDHKLTKFDWRAVWEQLFYFIVLFIYLFIYLSTKMQFWFNKKWGTYFYVLGGNYCTFENRKNVQEFCYFLFCIIIFQNQRIFITPFYWWSTWKIYSNKNLNCSHCSSHVVIQQILWQIMFEFRCLQHLSLCIVLSIWKDGVWKLFFCPFIRCFLFLMNFHFLAGSSRRM